MQLLHRHVVGDGDVVNVGVTDRSDGDLAIGAPEVERRRRSLVDRPWRWLRQVHGSDVVDGDDPLTTPGDDGDAVVTAGSDVALAVQAADCVPMALIADDGPFAVAHAGWRGLLAGVVGTAAGAVRDRSDAPIQAVVGPFIRVDRYEFGDEIEQVVDRFGAAVVGRTSSGRQALDMATAVRLALVELDIEIVADDGRCTSAPELFSHRLDGDIARHALVAWRER
ncbi:MAG: polyphenol oxidase family protein [Actinomycetota bacterium]